MFEKYSELLGDGWAEKNKKVGILVKNMAFVDLKMKLFLLVWGYRKNCDETQCD